MDKGQASLTAAKCADGSKDHYDDCDLQGAVGLDNVKRVSAEGSSCDFQDSRRAKKGKIPKIVTEVFELTTELVNQKSPANVVLSAELVFMKNALTTAHSEAKKAHAQMALLKQKNDTLKSDLHKGFNKGA